MAVRAGGMAAICDAVLARFLSAGFRERRPEVAATVSEMLLATPSEGYVGCCAALRDADLRNLVSTIEARSLVMGGELDEAGEAVVGLAHVAQFNRVHEGRESV